MNALVSDEQKEHLFDLVRPSFDWLTQLCVVITVYGVVDRGVAGNPGEHMLDESSLKELAFETV